MKFKNEIVSPKMAEKMLDGNTDNRRVSERTVQLYAIQMQTGRWKSGTAEPIKLSATGRVVDGQHRLLAVIKSKTPVEFTIAYDVDESVFDVLDTGKNRSGSDSFKVKGIKNDTMLPAMIAQYISLKDGRYRSKEKLSTNNALLEEYYSREVFWQGAANKTAGWYLNFAKILAPSMIGGLFALFYGINESTADEFMTQLCTGYNIKNKTIAALRNKLTQDKLSTLKMNTAMKTALIIKAWNMYRKNQEVKLIKFNQDKEEYPIAC